MSEEKDDIKKIQKTIDDILGIESGLSKKRASVKDKKREHFNTILTGLAHLNARSMGMKHDYKVDMMDYDDPFFNVIESLMDLHFNKAQKSLMEWWLYDKFLPTGEMLILKDQDSEKEIPTDTPDDIWELVQQYEKKDTK